MVDALPSRFLPFDFDGMDGEETQFSLNEHLVQYSGFGYTTTSYTRECPRLRAVLEASREVDRDERQRVCKVLQKEIQAYPWGKSIEFDESVYRAEQPLYTPPTTADTYHFDGPPVDVDTLLAQYQPETPKPRTTELPTTVYSAQTNTDLRSALNHLRSDDRDLWVAVGHALKELGDIGRELWLTWSQTSDKYDPADAAAKWTSFKPNQTGYESVFAKAQAAGWLNPRSNRAQGEKSLAVPTSSLPAVT